MIHSSQKDLSGWLLFFYSVPSKPVSNRMKVWRKLLKAGALQFKGAVYLLPYSDEHYELLQWLIAEIAAMDGDGGFARVERIETMSDREIVELFNQQREREYRSVEKGIEELERKVGSIRKGGGAPKDKTLAEQHARHLKAFEEIRKADFFSSRAGRELEKRFKAVRTELRELTGAAPGGAAAIVPKRREDYQKKTWATRKRPFIDRMASAWLIRTFIDAHASFSFIDETAASAAGAGAVTFDMRGGEFTHAGDLCTFEVLMKSFELRDRALKKIAEIVHELDIKDERYRNEESRGIEEILTGIRKTVKDDGEALLKGMAVFEMLYASKTQ